VILDAAGAHGEGELRYAWSFNQDVEITSGSETTALVVVKPRADSPVRVSLAVTDDNEIPSTVTRTIGLTRTAPMPCSQGCEAHEVCAAFDGTELCVDDLACERDDECGCLRCLSDDDGVRRCAAP